MVQFREMDDKISLRAQLEQTAAPVVLINLFNVASEDADKLLEAWTADAAFFKAQPGFISAQLHRGVGGNSLFLNYAVWESIELFRAAFSKPEFRSSLQRYPSSTVASPHIFQKVAVPGICVA